MYFIKGALRPGDRPAQEMDLIRKYHEQLVAHGVVDYSLDQCIQDLRLALLDLLSFMVIIIVLLDFSVNEEARAVRDIVRDRWGGAILEHNVGELL